MSKEPRGTSTYRGEISPELEPLLLEVADMRGGTWRFMELGDRDYLATTGGEPACVATAQFDSDATGALLTALASEDPSARAVRLVFNGIIGDHGSQLWNEVWSFESERAVVDTVAAMDQALQSVALEDCLDAAFDGDDITLTTPAFTLPQSAAYAFDVHDRVAPPDQQTHIELHLIQRGRLVALVVFYDHDPAHLWTIDSERLLTLFEERLAAAP